MRRNDLIGFCLEQINNYPDESIDEEVMLVCTEFIQSASSGNNKNLNYIMQKDGLQKVVLQLIIALEELTQKADNLEKDVLLMQVKILEKLCLATTSIV